MEFGEYGHQTIAREIKEEIGAEATNIRFLGTIENVFTFEGKPGHQVVLVYDGDFVDKSLYSTGTIEGHDERPGGEIAIKAVWKPIEYFRKGEAPLYPNGLIELLTKNHRTAR